MRTLILLVIVALGIAAGSQAISTMDTLASDRTAQINAILEDM